MSRVEVNTAESETLGGEVDVVTAGRNAIVVDTTREEPVHRPISRKPPQVETVATATYTRPPAREKTPSPLRETTVYTPPPSKQSHSIENASFQEAMKETLPPTEPTTGLEDDIAPMPPTPFSSPSNSPGLSSSSSSLGASGDECSSGGEEDGGAEDQEEEEEDEKSTTPPPKGKTDDVEIIKMKLIEEINNMTAEGFLPPQPPSISFSVEVLTKILQHQQRAADQQFGVDLMNFGFCNLVHFIEGANEYFDPCGRLFGGRSLKLKGLTEKVMSNINAYKRPFRKIYGSLKTDRLEKASPYIMMAIITSRLVQQTHVENVRKEMKEEADDLLRKESERHQQHQPGARRPMYDQTILPPKELPPTAQPKIVDPATIPIPSDDSDEDDPPVNVAQPMRPMSDDSGHESSSSSDDEIVVRKAPPPSKRGGRRKKKS